MSDYTQITDFSAKDSLSTGDPEKIILGADLDGELAAIQTAVGTKYDSNDLASQSESEAGTSNAKLITPLRLQNFRDYNVQYKYKDTLTSRNTTTTVADDPDLAGFTVEAATYYDVEGFLVLDSGSAVPDFDFLLDSDQTLQLEYLSFVSCDEGGGATTGLATNSITSTELTVQIGASDAVHVFLKGSLLGHATNDATVDLQWAQNTSNGTDVTLNAGSWLKISKMGT